MYSKIESILKEKNLTIADMCRAIGVNQSVFSNLKTRDAKLSVDNLAKVAKYLGVTMEDLIKEEN